MTNEELDRRITFIIEQQAQFASDIMQLREAQAQTEQALAQTGQIVAQTGEIVGRTGEIVTRLANVTLEGFKDVNAKIDALVDSQIRLNEAQLRTDENLSRTDESLRNLIVVVDRYFSQGRNGQ